MAEEKIQSFEIYTPKFNFDFKGHTKIELSNPYTTKVFEDDNTVQTAIVAKQLRTMGSWDNDIFAGSWSPLWRYLFGGIFLFDMPITVGEEYMPQGVTMTANGSAGTTNNNTPLSLGSWDAVKSTNTASQCKMVYNWSQQQGNGDIASVCLSSRIGGYIGYGNKDGVQKTPTSFFTDQHVGYISAGSIQRGDETPTNSVFKDSYIQIRINNTDKVVTVKVTPFSMIKYDILAETKTITLNYSTALTGNMLTTCFIPDGKGKFAISERKAAAVGESRQVLVLDMNTETLTEYTVTNNTSSSWATSSVDKNSGDLCGFDGEHVYFADTRSSSSTVYKIRLSDSAVRGSVSSVDTSISSNSNYVPISPITTNHKVVYADSKWCIWDETNDTKYPINLSNTVWTENNRGTSRIGYHEQIDAMSTMPNVDYYNADLHVGKNPLYLATINNLQEIVTKTNEDSMIVTYTLEKVTT